MKKILLAILILIISACHTYSPEPQEVFSALIKVDTTDSFEKLITNAVKDFGLTEIKSSFKNNMSEDFNKKMMNFSITSAEKEFSYTLVSNILSESCFRVSIFSKEGNAKLIKNALIREIKHSYPRVAFYNNSNCLE